MPTKGLIRSGSESQPTVVGGVGLRKAISIQTNFGCQSRARFDLGPKTNRGGGAPEIACVGLRKSICMRQKPVQVAAPSSQARVRRPVGGLATAVAVRVRRGRQLERCVLFQPTSGGATEPEHGTGWSRGTGGSVAPGGAVVNSAEQPNVCVMQAVAARANHEDLGFGFARDTSHSPTTRSLYEGQSRVIRKASSRLSRFCTTCGNGCASARLRG